MIANANIVNNNLHIVDVEGPNFLMISQLEKLNVNRIEIEKNVCESFFQNVNFPELWELSMVSSRGDSELTLFDKRPLPKLEKIDLEDNIFDNIPLEYAAN